MPNSITINCKEIKNHLKQIIMKKFYLFLIFIGLCNVHLMAQISQYGKPYSFENAAKLSSAIPEVVMPYVDVPQLLIQDSIDEAQGLPWRFGKEIEVDLNLKNSGLWENLENGDRLWRLKITSNGALSINLIYENFYLPPCSKFYLYDISRNTVQGAFSSENNDESGIFATDLISGESVILEYYEPYFVKGLGEITVVQVVHGYKSIFQIDDTKEYNSSLPCCIDINCPLGNNWQNEKKGVVNIICGGSTFSGSLINNEWGDGKPYILTAWHVSHKSEIPKYVFWFNYENPVCNPLSDTTPLGPDNNTSITKDPIQVPPGVKIKEIWLWAEILPEVNNMDKYTYKITISSATQSWVSNEYYQRWNYMIVKNHINFSIEEVTKIKIESIDKDGVVDQIKLILNVHVIYDKDPAKDLKKTLNRAELIAERRDTDFRLIKLKDIPPPDYNVLYNGWDRTNDPKNWSYGISHPRGDLKKIAYDKNAYISTKYGKDNSEPDANYWKVTYINGTVRPGSSGSPLFNPDHKIVGQLSAITCGCKAINIIVPVGSAWYGKLHKSWDGQNAAERLKDHLAKEGSTITNLGNFDPGDPTKKPRAIFKGNPRTAPTNYPVKLTDLSFHYPSSWYWTITPPTGVTFINGTDSISQNPEIEFAYFGLYTISLSVTNSIGSDDTTSVNYIEIKDFSGQSLWTGIESSDWFDPINWSTGLVPSSISDVIIQDADNYPIIDSGQTLINNLTISFDRILVIAPNGSLTTIGNITNNGYLYIDSDSTGASGSLIDNGALTGTGTFSFNRKYNGSEWHLISSPISNATANMFLGLYLQNHTESTNAYINITDPATLLYVMQGYALWNNLAGTASFVGTLNTGNMPPYFLSRTGLGSNYGWNIVGNPYPSPIDWNAVSGWTKTNVDNATYRHVNNATWASYVDGVGANGGTQYIAPNQGFFVGVTSGFTSGTLSMTNDVRTHSTAPFFKDEIADIVRLEVTGNGYTDETVIRFLDVATAEFDGQWDAHKLFGIVDEAPQLYSIANNILSINSLPECEKVSLGIKAGINGLYTISATEINDLPFVILEDKETGIFTDLKTSIYPFNSSGGTDNNRFILHFKDIPIDNADKGFVIYSNHNQIVVYNSLNLEGEVKIYNVMGQEIINKQIIAGFNNITLGNSSGHYIVNVRTSESVVNKKVFIH
jgi:PKD repeat protein